MYATVRSSQERRALLWGSGFDGLRGRRPYCTLIGQYLHFCSADAKLGKTGLKKTNCKGVVQLTNVHVD